MPNQIIVLELKYGILKLYVKSIQEPDDYVFGMRKDEALHLTQEQVNYHLPILKSLHLERRVYTITA